MNYSVLAREKKENREDCRDNLAKLALILYVARIRVILDISRY